MRMKGLLTKMQTEKDHPIRYFLSLEENVIEMNLLLDKKIRIVFDHFQCTGCGKEKEIYAMGCCKNCFFTSPHTGQWIVHPELSTAHLGKADRDLSIESEAQLQPHIVYLANSGGIKVGVTRKSQLPTRWIDQGAEYALPLAETQNRYEAGLIEVALKQLLSDKTNYRKMLKEPAPFEDLTKIKKSILTAIPTDLQSYILNEEEIVHLEYPVHKYPEKVKSIGLKKNPIIEGILTGIKGQYLLFNDNHVFNIRNHEPQYLVF